MLEWGSGGSTLYYGKRVGKLYSIEHDPLWGKTVGDWLAWRHAWARVLLGRKEPRVSYHVVEPNVPSPPRPSKAEDYRSYIDRVDLLGVPRFDVVLIDGRAREHCAQKALRYIDRSSIVFIHDYFTPGREYYGQVLQWYDIVEAVRDTPQTLVALRKKEGV